MMRLDKYLCHHAGLTRTEARAAIKTSIVTVNGEIVRSHGFKINLQDEIAILGKKIEEQGEIYLILHKPAGYICATEDEEQATVMELLPGYEEEGLHLAGRLDKDTTGLVLLSTDGKWTHKVTSPKKKFPKTYELETADPLHPDLVKQFEEGILLKDSPKPTAPAKLILLSEKTASLTLTEGRYHQVKRMFGACRNKVVNLHRSSVGELTLEGLEEGESRLLTEKEVQFFEQSSSESR